MLADPVAERFEILGHAGAGGMATVYRARDRRTGETVALKVLGQVAERERFVREAELLARLEHPNIVRHVAHGELEGGGAFLAMEWLEGESLSARLKRESLSVDDALRLCSRIATALGHAHARGIVHRDVKPSNVMLPASGDLDEVRVLDFGIARTSVRRDLTRTGMLVGTPGYMSPEQARGSRDVDARADVFALGCLLYKSLTQQAPFAGGTVVAVLAKILLEEPLPVTRLRPDVPAAVQRLVSTLLAKEPSARPRDGAEVAELLERARTAPQVEAPTPPAALALTAFEQRMLSVLLLDIGVATPLHAAGRVTPEGAEPDAEVTATLSALAEPIRAATVPFGAVPEPLADGSILVAFRGAGAEQAARAAKCAMAIARATPGVLAVLGTGRAVVDVGAPVGDLVDRIVSLRSRATRTHTRAHGASTIVVDAVSTTLLEERFELGTVDGIHLLRGEREGGEPVRTLLGRPSTCVGRDREIGQLVALFDECVEEDAPRAVLLTAPTGLGKSRVRYELVARIKGRAQVWMGRGDPMSAGAPFDLLTQAIRRAYGIRGDDPVGVRRDKLAARVARHVPEPDRAHTAEFVGEIVGAPAEEPVSAQLRAARKDPVLMGDQIRAAVRTLLRAECTAYPVVLVLEDLHWGDIPTVKLVDSLLRDLHGSALFVLATARPEIDDLFPRLWDEHGVLVLPLRELGRKPAAKLVRELLPGASDERVEALVARAGGNAFHLEELIRAVAQGSDSLPETVLATVAARLDHLEPDARRVLRAASVFGKAFWGGGVAALVGEGGDAARLLEWLATQEIVERRAESRFEREPEYVFRHSLLRDAAYATLTEADRATGHRLAGEWLAERGETNPVTLAEHFERGKDPARASAYWERAAEQALEGSDLARAIELTKRGLACGPDPETSARLDVLRSEAHRWLGELPLARMCANEALERAEAFSVVWYQALSQLAYASVLIGDIERIVSIAEELCDRRPTPEAADAYLVALSRVATSLAYGGHPDLADRVHARMEETLGWASPSDAALARVHLSTALRALRVKDDTTSLALFRAALEHFERIRDERGGVYVRVNLGVIQMELGDFERAERAFRAAIDGGAATGVISVAAGARVNLGLLRGYVGDPEGGLALLRESRTFYEKLGDERMMGIGRTYESILLLSRGEAAAAEAAAADAVRTLATIATSRADALAARARARLVLGRADEALRDATEAHGVLAELGSVDDGDVRVCLAFAESLLATGRRDRALEVLAETTRRLDERASRLDAPELRAFFSERVPENAAVLALARAHGVGAPAKSLTL